MDALWKAGRPSIYEFLRDRISDGTDSSIGDLDLPDEPLELVWSWARREFQAAAAAEQARRVAMRQEAWGDLPKRDEPVTADEVVAALDAAAVRFDTLKLRAVYELLLLPKVGLFSQDLQWLLRARERETPFRSALLAIGVMLATRAPDREAVNAGTTILGALAPDDYCGIILTLGRSSTLVLCAAEALANLKQDRDRTLWSLAKQHKGWGRIHTVDHLEATADPEIKAWMLRDGYRNSVLYEYLAYVCATTGGLCAALQAPYPDDALLRGAGEIICSLIVGGPARDMDDYADGAVAVDLYTKLVERWPSAGLEDFLALRRIAEYVEDHSADWLARQERGWTATVRSEMAERCRAVMARPEWKPRALAALGADDEHTVWAAKRVLQP
jgi:hypothetical protein